MVYCMLACDLSVIYYSKFFFRYYFYLGGRFPSLTWDFLHYELWHTDPAVQQDHFSKFISCISQVDRYLNPNQSGIPADSKGVACWYFNTNSPMPRLYNCKKRQKRLTLRVRLRYLENSDQCLKFTSCISLTVKLDLDLKTGVKNLTLTELSKYCNFAAKSRDEKSTKGVALVFKDRWGGPFFIRFFGHFHGEK